MELLPTLAHFYWRRKLRTVESDGILFAHHRPPVQNIGDELCSPRHYFQFGGVRSDLCVIGGGVFADWGLRLAARIGSPLESTVLWGVGLSRVGETIDKPAVPNYLLAGVRDKDSVSAEVSFVPCVSCLLPMLDLPVRGVSTLVFLNRATAVTQPTELVRSRNYAASKHWYFLDNSCALSDFAACLHDSRRVITNSFHGAYWSLLAGREVVVLGYSSKFINLLSAFDLPSRLIRVSRGGGDLSRVISSAETIESSGVQLECPASIRQEFREANVQFAERLVATRSAMTFKLRSNF